jgi:hypothetical protein
MFGAYLLNAVRATAAAKMMLLLAVLLCAQRVTLSMKQLETTLHWV